MSLRAAAPSEDGTGTTWNFQLHPAFWFGMAICDDQSAPNPGVACPPDSDKNIHTSTDPNSPNYIGETPGTALMEMQFYPPGWGPVSCTDGEGTQDGKWCSALTIDSDPVNQNTNTPNNLACQSSQEPERSTGPPSRRAASRRRPPTRSPRSGSRRS